MSALSRIACALGAHAYPRPWEADCRWRERVLGVRDGWEYYVTERWCRRCGWNEAQSEMAGPWSQRKVTEAER